MAEWSREVFAKNLRFYMDRSGKNQKELAEIVGVSAPTFNDWIKGKKYPRIDKVEKLANYFGILKSDLIELKADRNTPTGLGELHAEILKDEEFTEIYQYYKLLNAKKRKIVKDLIRNLADED